MSAMPRHPSAPARTRHCRRRHREKQGLPGRTTSSNILEVVAEGLSLTIGLAREGRMTLWDATTLYSHTASEPRPGCNEKGFAASTANPGRCCRCEARTRDPRD